ncbi:hypothetical protein QE372_005203 [Agrobacterium pusense]|uniref:hypothetical protein n=1 Tax=Agrobacterium pusense TaxID=648995 RepID=UPI00285722FB|nr:hypothetical protein [Agrobacterium pusense]MDR6192869.1 hypothetical protein [Agrobacterium pusense]
MPEIPYSAADQPDGVSLPLTADLRRVDVSYADFRAIDPQRIAIDDAGDPMAAAAFLKLYRSHI